MQVNGMKLAPNVGPEVREIFRRMTEKGLTQSSLAKKCGLNPTYFRDLFQGRSASPSSKYLPTIAAALECEQADLFGKREVVASGQSGDNGDVYQVDEVALVAFWRLLDEAGKQRIMREIIREARTNIPPTPPTDDVADTQSATQSSTRLATCRGP